MDNEKTGLALWWDNTKAWFKRSESIFLARLAAFLGGVTTFVASMDWSPLWSFLGTGTAFTKDQLLGIGISVVGAGITLELARRRNTKEIEGRLVPTADAELKVVKKKKSK